MFAAGLTTAPSVTDNLDAYWKGQEASGTRADETANAYDLKETAATVSAETGKVGTNAMSFVDDDSKWLYVDDNTALNYGDVDFHVCGWIKFTTLPAAIMAVWGRNQAANDRSYVFYLDNSGPTFKWELSSDGTAGTLTTISYAGLTPTTGTWYFCRTWYDAGYDAMGMSVWDESGTIYGAEYAAQTAGAYSAGAAKFNIGGMGADTNGQLPLDGAAEEVMVHSRVLTGEDVLTIFNEGSGQTFSV